jgi:hypothetical protein
MEALGNLEDEKFTTVKVAADWPSDSASDWASHSTVFNHSKVDYLNPFFWLLLKTCHVMSTNDLFTLPT